MTVIIIIISLISKVVMEKLLNSCMFFGNDCKAQNPMKPAAQSKIDATHMQNLRCVLSREASRNAI